MKPPQSILDDNNFKILRVENERGKGTRSGIIFPVEDGYWLVGLAGYMGDHPPRSDEGDLIIKEHHDECNDSLSSNNRPYIYAIRLV